ILLGLFVTRSILVETAPVSVSKTWETPGEKPRSSALRASAGPNSMERVDDRVMPQSETVATRSIPWSATISLLWVLGTLFMTLRIVAQGWGVRRIRRSCVPLENRAALEMADEIRKVFKISREVRLRVTDRVDIPSVVGVLWPAVLLPTSLLSGLPPDQVRAILAHELAHIRRWDYLVNLAQMGVEAILFFNPAVWWVSRQVRVEREVCCDFMAARALGSGLDYARALANLAATLPSISQPEMSPAFSGNQTEWHLLDRIKRLAAPHHRPHLHLPWYSLVGLFLAGTVIAFGLWRGADVGVKVVKNLFLTPEQVERLVEIEEEFGPAVEEYEEGSNAEDKVTLSGTIRTRDGKPLTVKKSLRVR
ncbi:MAG: M56 family metallopeptidase, partial [Candidatus Omnitrophica bacterium]|nr:M56 family metallopeptidase [Candidatus Omnitrophota bacterium]